MITRETDYAIRTVLALSLANAEGRLLSAAELAEQMQVPYRFQRSISRKLVAAGILTSRRGHGGGLWLNRAPSELSLLQIMRVMDPKSAILNRCIVAPGECGRNGHCPIHQYFLKMQEKLDRMLDAVKFEQLKAGEMMVAASDA